MTTPKTKAVIISDIHFNLANLDLATEALRTSLMEARYTGVPLIISGDLTDTKAIIRGEIANRLIDIFLEFRVKTYIIPGNHDLLNEKNQDHNLNFLKPYATVIDYPTSHLGLNFIPYQANKEKFLDLACKLPEDATIICHQGFKGAHMGDYIQDKTSVDPALLGSRRIISGHYHKRQEVTPKISYVGNPYTMSFGEANDPTKGYCLLQDDGSLIPMPLHMRKHVVVTSSIALLEGCINELGPLKVGDLLWVKVSGPRSQLRALDKDHIGKLTVGHSNFKLDLIPDTEKTNSKPKNLSREQLFDAIIESTKDTEKQKTLLKELYREIIGS